MKEALKDLSIEHAEYLISVIQELSMARSLEGVIEITRHAARALTGADGATFVLKDGDMCHYVDEDAIGPLWKGLRFPMTSCISGYAMIHGESVIVPDIFQDPRIPIEAYQVTFVKSVLMVPIRKANPIGAIGNYWSTVHEATAEEIRLLEALANCTSVALENVKLISKLTEANYSLEKSLFSRDEFISIASHELRTPISALKLELQMVNRKLKHLTIDDKEPLTRSLKDVERLQKLVEQLLDVSRISVGQLALQEEEVDAGELIKHLTTLMAPPLVEAKCLVNVQLESGIKCHWDTLKIEQILTNILSNIIRHAPGSTVNISLSKKNDQEVLLAISDTGPGISLETQSRLFKRFEKGKETYSGGLGLGLYIMKSLVEAHGGSVSLSSRLGGGTRFQITLPCRHEETNHSVKV